MKITFVDTNPAVIEELRKAFLGVEETSTYCGMLQAIVRNPGSVIVAPGNSFGIMDGGFDQVLRDMLRGVEGVVQSRIKQRWGGELPVGACEYVWAEHLWDVLYAPTMRVPMDVSTTLNAYLAFRAALVVAVEYAEDDAEILCPGLCTLSGKMPPERAAAQMRLAWDSVKRGHPNDWDGVRDEMSKLMRA